MISPIIIIGLILSMYIAWRMIRTLRKKQRKTNYTLELQRRPSKEIWEDYKLETTDDKTHKVQVTITPTCMSKQY